jgi:hypothetical protein
MILELFHRSSKENKCALRNGNTHHIEPDLIAEKMTQYSYYSIAPVHWNLEELYTVLDSTSRLESGGANPVLVQHSNTQQSAKQNRAHAFVLLNTLTPE